MGPTQQSVLSLLLSEGGKVRKSELVGKFRDALDCADPAERERNKELFKTLVNSVAFVKEIDGVRYVVVKKKFQHLLQQEQTPADEDHVERTSTEDKGDGGCEVESLCRSDPGDQTDSPSAVLLALERSRSVDGRARRTLNFQVPQNPAWCSNEPAPPCRKPYALPLRVPPSATGSNVLRGYSDDPPGGPSADSCGYKPGNGQSPDRQLRAPKAPEEPKEPRFPSMVPLDQAEHEWLARCASGHWSQAYGLLLRDLQLAEKRDFVSGFTALHWAAKCGNSEMLAKILDLSKQGGVDVDVNAKTFGGYTALHIAALHDQEYILGLLARKYGADVTLRDNCGKRAYHYLHKGISGDVREMLGEPKVQPRTQEAGREETDAVVDLPKGLHTISRLFQPHMTGHRKKTKQRPGFYSLTEGPGEDREDRDKHRVVSDVFM